jgi:hypothetical protein
MFATIALFMARSARLPQQRFFFNDFSLTAGLTPNGNTAAAIDASNRSKFD